MWSSFRVILQCRVSKTAFNAGGSVGGQNMLGQWYRKWYSRVTYGIQVFSLSV